MFLFIFFISQLVVFLSLKCVAVYFMYEESIKNGELAFRCTVLIGGADTREMIRDLERGVRNVLAFIRN